MFWVKVILAVSILGTIAGGGWYMKTLIQENQQLVTSLEAAKKTNEFVKKSIADQKRRNAKLNVDLANARKAKVKVVERVIKLKERTTDFKKGIDKELPKDVEIEFTQGLKALSCATGNKAACKK